MHACHRSPPTRSFVSLASIFSIPFSFIPTLGLRSVLLLHRGPIFSSYIKPTALPINTQFSHSSCHRSNSVSMASSLYAQPITLTAIFFFSFVISVSSSEPLFLSLTHSLSKSQFNTTPHHLLKSTSARSVARFLHYRNRHRHRRLAHVSLPLSSGSDYTLSLTLHSQPITLYMDTGSDVVWSPCTPLTCILCEGMPKPNPITITITSSLAFDVPCKSPACTAVHSSHSSSDLCAMARCPLDSIETSDCASFSCPPFYYAYGDGSFVASLKTAVVSLPTSSPQPLALHNFTFGCAHTTLAEPVGVAGFGRGSLSFPAQLAKSLPQLGNQFSYCLVSHSFDVDRVRRPSPLILGRYDSKEKDSTDSKAEFVYTPMLDSPTSPYFYSVGLEGITVGRRTIPAPETLRKINGRGDDGVVVDSGTTFTILPSGLFRSVVAEFDRQLGRAHPRATSVEEKTGLSPCYYLSGGDVAVNVPDVALRFVGAGSSVGLPRENYFYEFVDGGDGRRKVGCVMLVDGGDEADMGGGPGATLGNYQQQGFEVVYDLEGRRVGFAKRQCASLWETLRRR